MSRSNTGVHLPRSLLLVLALALASSLAAQTPAPSQPHPWPRFTIVYALGGSMGGPGNALADDMAAAGYDSTSPGGCIIVLVCFGPTYHPFAEGPHGSTTALAARVALSRTFALGAGYEKGGIGGATGLGTNGYLTTSWTSTTIWTAAYWTPSRGFRLGAGPSIHTLTQPTDQPVVHRVGLTGEMGVQFPRYSMLFCDIATRYHLIPTTEVQIGTPGSPAVMMAEPHWSHFSILFGLGLRI